MKREVNFSSQSNNGGRRAGSQSSSASGGGTSRAKSGRRYVQPGEYDYFGLYSDSAADSASGKIGNGSASAGGRTEKSANSKNKSGSAGGNKKAKPDGKSTAKKSPAAKNSSGEKKRTEPARSYNSRAGAASSGRERSGALTKNAQTAQRSSVGRAGSAAGSGLPQRKTAGGTSGYGSRRSGMPSSSKIEGMEGAGRAAPASGTSGSVRPAARPSGAAGARSANPITDKPARKSGRKNKKKRRRHGSPILLYIMLIVVVLGISAALCCTVFFGAESIEVVGTSRYSAEQIISASSLKTGDNIFVTGRSGGESNIVTQLPYIRSAEISYTIFPPKFVITVEETQAKYVTEDSSVILDGELKILDTAAAPEADRTGLTVLKGIELTSPESGKTAVLADEDTANALSQITESLARHGINDVTKIDLSDAMDIRITYQGRIYMLFGSTAELEYKMSYAKEMLVNQLASSQEGKLDLSWLVSGNSTVYFTQGSVEMFEAEPAAPDAGGVSSENGSSTESTSPAVPSEDGAVPSESPASDGTHE